MKILIIHDRFQFKGGAERLVLILARALNTDIVTEFWTEESFGQKEAPDKTFVLSHSEAHWIVWRYFRAQFLFFFKTRKIIKNYDTIIFSGNNCLAASFHFRKKRKILYCHSPVRHAFDLFQLNRSEQKRVWKKIIYYNIGAWLIRFVYWFSLKNMDIVIANSKNIKNRLQKYLGQPSDAVIYPPIEINKFKWLGQKNYYLSFGRIERLKRIPDIIKAFQKMPDKKLVVVSGGPDLEKIRTMAKRYDNIEIVGWVNDQELAKYLGHCIASIYIPINEDFGMTPLESMSAGKPCIGVYDGGLKESILDKLNGKFIPADYSIDDIIHAVEWLTAEKALSMRENCERRSSQFSESRFIKEVKNLINDYCH